MPAGIACFAPLMEVDVGRSWRPRIHASSPGDQPDREDITLVSQQTGASQGVEVLDSSELAAEETPGRSPTARYLQAHL